MMEKKVDTGRLDARFEDRALLKMARLAPEKIDASKKKKLGLMPIYHPSTLADILDGQ